MSDHFEDILHAHHMINRSFSMVDARALLLEAGINWSLFENDTELFSLSMDVGSSDHERLPSLSYRAVATFCHTLIFLLGVSGNSVLIYVARKVKTLQTPTYCYLVSLAYADLLVILTVVPEAIIKNYIGNRWLLGHVGCSLFIYLSFLGINAGSVSILAFTIERYIAICRPLLARKVCTMERTTRIIHITWIFTAVYCSPWLFLSGVRTDDFDPSREHCELRLSTLRKETYIAVFGPDLLLFYLTPLLVAIVVYARIGRILYLSLRVCRRGTSMEFDRTPATTPLGATQAVFFNGSYTVPEKEPNTNETGSLTATPTNMTPMTASARRHAIWTMRSRVQVLRMLMVIVILFAIAWLPYRGLLVYNTFVETPWLDIWYLFFAKTLIYLNSAMNPFLYNAMSRRFRMAVRQTLVPKAFRQAKLKKKQQIKSFMRFELIPVQRPLLPVCVEQKDRSTEEAPIAKAKSKEASSEERSSNHKPLLHRELGLFVDHYVPYVTSDHPPPP